MIKKRYDELKPGDVFQLTNGRTYILVVEALSNGTKVRVNGYRDADPAKGVHSFSTRYLADREVEVYSLDEIAAPLARLGEWAAAHGGDSYTFGGKGASGQQQQVLPAPLRLGGGARYGGGKSRVRVLSDRWKGRATP